MPEKKTVERARRKLREGKRPTTAAGEFVREEVHHVREGKHGVRSPQQAIAIGLSKARRAGVPLAPPGKGQAKEKTRRSAARAYEAGQGSPGARARRPAAGGRAKGAAARRGGKAAGARGGRKTGRRGGKTGAAARSSSGRSRSRRSKATR